MSPRTDHTPLEGSGHPLLHEAESLGFAEPDVRHTISLHLRHGAALPDTEALIARARQRSAYLDHATFLERYGSDKDDIRIVKAFMESKGFEVTQIDLRRRRVLATGLLRQIAELFSVKIMRFSHDRGDHHAHEGPLHLPPELAGRVTGVFGIDTRPVFIPHCPTAPDDSGPPEGLSFASEFARLYNFPTHLDGSGQRIGIIELGGGYRSEDLKRYFEDLQGIPVPKIVDVSVHGGTNNPTGDPNSFDAEVMLDIEVAGSVAPGADQILYFAPSSDEMGLIEALKEAVHDTTNAPSILSVSWGCIEKEMSEQGIRAVNEILSEAALLGITVLCATGDHGSSLNAPGGGVHVWFPASSPLVVACGGTALTVKDGQIVDEVVWDEDHFATGGGISTLYECPSFQVNVAVPESGSGRKPRGIPDVAANAAGSSGYVLLVDGTFITGGGTSAVSPLLAGLIAMVNQDLGKRVGYITPILYDLTDSAIYREIVSGTNGAYSAGPGWDPCTGLGSMDGMRFLDACRQFHEA